MVFIVTIERGAGRMFVVECAAIPGCVSQGRTEAEAMRNIRKAIRECLEVRAERGMPISMATRSVEIALR